MRRSFYLDKVLIEASSQNEAEIHAKNAFLYNALQTRYCQEPSALHRQIASGSGKAPGGYPVEKVVELLKNIAIII